MFFKKSLDQSTNAKVDNPDYVAMSVIQINQFSLAKDNDFE